MTVAFEWFFESSNNSKERVFLWILRVFECWFRKLWVWYRYGWWCVRNLGPDPFQTQHDLLSYFLSEVYFSEVKYISISHFLWKIGIFQKKHKSHQGIVVHFFYGKLVLHYLNNHSQTQNWTHHHLLPQIGNLFVTDICPISKTPDISQLICISWTLPTNWAQFRGCGLSEH